MLTDHLDIIKKALERYKRRMEEITILGWYKDTTVTQNEIARIESAIIALEAAQTTEVWTPVDSYINQEILSYKTGGSIVIDTKIMGRHIELSNSEGCEISTLLRPDHAVCRRTKAAEVNDAS